MDKTGLQFLDYLSETNLESKFDALNHDNFYFKIDKEGEINSLMVETVLNFINDKKINYCDKNVLTSLIRAILITCKTFSYE